MTDAARAINIGIAGAGSVAFGTAARLAELGHAPTLWSPSGQGTKALASGAPLVAKGAVVGTFALPVARDAADLCAHNDVILIAVPGYGHKAVMDALAPHLTAAHRVIISSHASFGALYLSAALNARGITIPIVAWGTTMTTGRRTGDAEVTVNTVRSLVDLCVIPASKTDTGLDLCRDLFGDRFTPRDGLMAITLSNLNPQNHMGIALGNMTRMERGETWSQSENVTPNVGRLMENLDQERLAIAAKLGLEVRTIFDHYHLSYHVPVASISEMNQELVAQGSGGNGPATADSRYITEDVPYGLVMTVVLGDLVGVPAPLHRAGVDIFSAMYGRDFFAENALLNALDLPSRTLEELKKAAYEGM